MQPSPEPLRQLNGHTNHEFDVFIVVCGHIFLLRDRNEKTKRRRTCIECEDER